MTNGAPPAHGPAARGQAIRPPDTLERELVTPEGVFLRIRVGRGGQRAAAFILDALLILALLVALTLFAVSLGFSASTLSGSDSAVAAPLVIWLLGAFLLRNLYFMLFELGPRAATPGKRWLGLRVAARDGGRLSADAVIARNLSREVEVFLPVAFLATGSAQGEVGAAIALCGLMWTGFFLFLPLFNRDRLRMGDIIGGTWVVDARRRRLEVDVLDVPRPISSGRQPAGALVFSPAQLSAYGIYELQALENVLRRGEPSEIATAAAAIRTRIGWTAREDDRDFLATYYAALRPHLERNLAMGRRRGSKHEPA